MKTKNLFSICCLVLLFLACQKTPKPGELVSFSPADNSFSAQLPNDWKVDDRPGETRKAVFFGPAQGNQPFSQMVGVYFHSSQKPEFSGQAYIASMSDGIAQTRELKVGNLPAIESIRSQMSPSIHSKAQKSFTRTVVVITQKGFYSLEHTWPAGAEENSAFEVLLRTFKPNS